jgi:hypothetical protein
MVIVLSIILLLAALLMSAVMKVMAMVPEVQTRTEISQMDVALAAFQQDYNLGTNPPPSTLILCESLSQYATLPPQLSAAGQQSLAFLLKTFGKNLSAGAPFLDWNGNNVADGPHILEGEMCLVFYLGGIPDVTNTACLGFSTNNNNPTQAGGNRKGPYFPFASNRLIPAGLFKPNQLSPFFFVYLDPWMSKIGGKQPYAYFSSNGVNNRYSITDCATIGANAYFTAIPNPALPPGPTNIPTAFVNPKGYQILSAGKDGMFGSGNYIGNTTDAGTGHDDQANFSARILGANQQ